MQTLSREGDRGSFAAEVAHGWRAGRGPHGGYLAAIILRALTLALDDPLRSPRSLTIHFLKAPDEGPLLIETTIERSGRSLSSLSARMSQNGATMGLALAAFSVPWQGPEWNELPMPDGRAAGPRAPPRHPDPARARPRLRELHRPAATLRRHALRGRAEQPLETGGWLGLVEPRPLDALALAFFTDALIPTPFMRLPGPAPAPTIDITIHFRTALPRPAARRRRAPTPTSWCSRARTRP